VQFSLDGPAGGGAGRRGVIFDPLIVDNGTTKFDLEFGVTDTGDGLTATLHYDANRFDPETIATMAGCLATVARSVAADTRRPGHGPGVHPGPTYGRAWRPGPPAPRSTPPATPVTLLTDAMRGGATAVSASDGSLTRDEVLRWAGKIAAALRDDRGRA